jgi:hypothetical protein
MAKNNKTWYIVGGIIIIILLILVINNSVSNQSNNSQNNAGVNKEADIAYAQKIMNLFAPMWRSGNHDCNSYKSQKLFGDDSYTRGELSFALNIDNHEDTKLPLTQSLNCYIQVNQDTPFPITFTEEVTIKDNAYLGTGNVFENQNITLTCGDAGKIVDTIYALCP